jgi:hypothetical protein
VLTRDPSGGVAPAIAAQFVGTTAGGGDCLLPQLLFWLCGWTDMGHTVISSAAPADRLRWSCCDGGRAGCIDPALGGRPCCKGMADPAVDGREEAVAGTLGPGDELEEAGSMRGVREERLRPCNVVGLLGFRGACENVGEDGGEFTGGELTWPTSP